MFSSELVIRSFSLIICCVTNCIALEVLEIFMKFVGNFSNIFAELVENSDDVVFSCSLSWLTFKIIVRINDFRTIRFKLHYNKVLTLIFISNNYSNIQFIKLTARK